jgi:hypothetical protein
MLILVRRLPLGFAAVVHGVVALGTAGRARAQSPAEVPAVTPTPSTTVQQPPPEVDPMATRWGVGVAVVPASLTAQTSDAQHVGVAAIELDGRFRIRRWLEVGVAVSAGGSSADGSIATGGLYAEARYRFLTDLNWNGFAGVGLGVASVAQSTASTDDRAGRPSVRLGAGVERRFGSLGFEAELRAVGIAHNPKASDTMMTTTAAELAADGVAGLALALGAIYYF